MHLTRRKLVVLSAVATGLVLTGGVAVATGAEPRVGVSGLQQLKQQLEQQLMDRALQAPRYVGPTPGPWPKPTETPHATNSDGRGFLPFWQSVSSLWFLDYIPAYNQTQWNPLYLWAAYSDPSTGTGVSSIGTTLLNAPGDQQQQYERYWPCPRTVGKIVITAVTGLISVPSLAGVVSFSTAAGGNGSFNLATETWTFTA
jgi:hypothetical protein